MDKINLTISLFALVIAIATAFAAHYYYTRNDQRRRREIILETLKALDRYDVLAHNVERERNKTGCPIDEDERNTFALLQTCNEQMKKAAEATNQVLSNKSKISDEILHTAEMLKRHTDSLSNWLEMLQTRFMNFNNNCFADISGKIEAFKKDLERITDVNSRKK
jgi:hypothetical protein